MVKLVVRDREGMPHMIEATAGISLMEAIRDAGINELSAICGGACSCATCHVYIDERSRIALPVLSSDEDDLLDCSTHRQPGSRLACQLQVVAELEWLVATIAPED